MTTFKNNGNKKLFLIIGDVKTAIDPNGTFAVDLGEKAEIFVTFCEPSTTVKKRDLTKFHLLLDTKLIISAINDDAEISLTNKGAAFFADTTTYEWIESECISGNIELKKQYLLVNEKEILDIYRLEFAKDRRFNIFFPFNLIGAGVLLVSLIVTVFVNIGAGLIALLVPYSISCAVQALLEPTIHNRTKKKLKDSGYPDDMILFTQNIGHLIDNQPEKNEFWWDYWKRTKGI